ncbi:hypothetical protein Dimus_021293 [Dionaea muscipula]
MAKSLRSKREKRLRAIRRDIVKPFYEDKDAAKLAAQAAALAAPKLPVRSSAMEVTPSASTATSNATMDVDMEGNQAKGSLKPTGGVGKKLRRKLKIAKKKRRGKGIGKKNI